MAPHLLLPGDQLHPPHRPATEKGPDRYSFERPDYADITVGGPYHAGEDIPDGVREIHEELGLPVPYADLPPLGVRQTAVTLAPDYIEREFQHWHLLPLDVELTDELITLAVAQVMLGYPVNVAGFGTCTAAPSDKGCSRTCSTSRATTSD